jgi:hypothetical protein
VFEKNPAHGAVLLAPAKRLEIEAEFLSQQPGTFVPEPVNYWAGPAAMVVVELGAGAFEITAVVEELKAAEKVL